MIKTDDTTSTHNLNPDKPAQPASCSTASCGRSGGICPGIALAIGLLTGTFLASLTGQEWLTIPTALVLGLILTFWAYPGGSKWPLRK